MEIEISEERKKVIEDFNKGRNILLTGPAGTGKSVLIKHLEKTTKKSSIIIAPTGIAALNIDGFTIHSTFQFKPDITLEEVHLNYKIISRLKHLEVIFIDEISMVRSDLLDCLDRSLRIHRRDSRPFGGVQMVLSGDLFQLPPVFLNEERDDFLQEYNSELFYDARCYEKGDFRLHNLKKIYRQSDIGFQNLLNRIRKFDLKPEDIDIINSRVNLDFEPKNDDFHIILTPTNSKADKINNDNLQKLETTSYHLIGKIKNNFPKHNLPTHLELEVKVGSQIMFVKNDSRGRWVNGTVGKILKIVDIKKENSKPKREIHVELSSGEIVRVGKDEWEMSRLRFKHGIGLYREVVGTFTQFPIKLAWAVTIHKSQSKTFDNVILDIGHGAFASGQLYVALSRATNFEGLVLKKPIRERDIIVDSRIIDFLVEERFKNNI